MNAAEWIAAYGRAWVGRDPEAAVALFTEDAVYRSSPFREPSVGSEGIRDYWTRATSTQEELDLRFGDPIVEGSKVVVEWWAIMRDEGDWITLPGALLLRFAGRRPLRGATRVLARRGRPARPPARLGPLTRPDRSRPGARHQDVSKGQSQAAACGALSRRELARRPPGQRSSPGAMAGVRPIVSPMAMRGQTPPWLPWTWPSTGRRPGPGAGPGR